MTPTDTLKQIVGTRLLENEPMSKHTNFRIGGPAKWFVEIRSLDELTRVLGVVHENGLSMFVFGGGSNLLVADAGFDGIAIKMAMRTCDIQGTRVRAEAGVLSSGLARATANAGLKGLTWAISLPGTVGGGVRGNAGCFGGEMKDHLVSVQVLRLGFTGAFPPQADPPLAEAPSYEVIELSPDDLTFGYRESAIKHSDDIVLSATFELEEGDSRELKAELDDILMKRKTSQPLDAVSAGCMFKNYEISSDEELQRLETKFDCETKRENNNVRSDIIVPSEAKQTRVPNLDLPSEMKSARKISAGWLIDKLGLKGTRIGGAKVSERHGNFVVNTGSATAEEVVQLIALIKTRVRNEFGIQLHEEVQYVGF